MNDILQSVTHGYNDSEVESISSSSTDSEDSDYVHAMDESELDVSLNIFLLICLTQIPLNPLYLIMKWKHPVLLLC